MFEDTIQMRNNMESRLCAGVPGYVGSPEQALNLTHTMMIKRVSDMEDQRIEEKYSLPNIIIKGGYKK